jgi:DNA-binding transcriptional MerR regulator
MSVYSIKDLEKLSGIKAHTIRIWEKRYGIIEPHRTTTNIRYYDDAQLKHLLNVSLLVNNGHKISKISQYATDDISNHILNLYDNPTGTEEVASEADLNILIVAMMDLDEEMFEKVFSRSVMRLGFIDTVTHLVYPFLEKVGILWGINYINPAQEHFISNLIRQKLIVAVDGLSLNKESDKNFLLILPEQELHEVGLLMANYLLRANGCRTFYLGQSVPLIDIQKVCAISNPNYLLTFITTPKSAEEIELYLKELKRMAPGAQILLSGYTALFDQVSFPEDTQAITSPEQLIAPLSKIRNSPHSYSHTGNLS